jgi:hypothetical protein
MSIPLIVDANSYQYPAQGDKANTGWGGQATSWASAVTAALTKLGLGGTLSPIANAVINIDSTSKGILIPRMTTVQRDAITSPTNSLLIFNTTLKVVQYYDSSVSTWISIGARLPDNAVFSGTLQVNGVTYLNNDTTPNTPVISFTGDTDTGIGRSAANTLDLITGGQSKFRIEPTGQIKAVYESQVGTDYNTQLDNGYFCRAWVNFNGTGTVAIRASGNISSITDNGTGDYTINFTTALPDGNYSVVGSTGNQDSGVNRVLVCPYLSANTVNSCRIATSNTDTANDWISVNLGVFR